MVTIHLQLIKFWPFRALGKGYAVGRKFLAPPYYRQRAVFVSLSAFYCATQICISRTCYGDVAGWVDGWLSVTRRYCIKTAKPILKRFRPSGSPIILASSDPCADTQFQGEPFSGALETQG